ncbi:MAG: Holliday junction resolvase RuvX [Candidatus Omnitrophica bacterium]|nr:Holliday junction resolvase RuvX [Candidatus Omnitrophota bacterium]
MRILGLDVGTKRIGVALSDTLLITAQGMETIERKDLKSDIDSIKKTVSENSVTEIVVGLPLNMSGTYSEKTKEVVAFIDNLKASVDIPVKTWDERLTSLQAERIMLESDMSRQKRKRLSDKIAAQIILQSYMGTLKKG